jgi:hypothetical protein
MTREDRLFERAEAIMQRRANGFYLPILQHLARRSHGEGMLILAQFNADNDCFGPGVPAQVGSAAWLYRRLWHRGGEVAALAAQNLAMIRFDVGDLQGYRHWLRRAALSGDVDAGHELRRFETRQPSVAARAIGRGRPWRRIER